MMLVILPPLGSHLMIVPHFFMLSYSVDQGILAKVVGGSMLAIGNGMGSLLAPMATVFCCKVPLRAMTRNMLRNL